MTIAKNNPKINPVGRQTRPEGAANPSKLFYK
jgi:hypothetical protein